MKNKIFSYFVIFFFIFYIFFTNFTYANSIKNNTEINNSIGYIQAMADIISKNIIYMSELKKMGVSLETNTYDKCGLDASLNYLNDIAGIITETKLVGISDKDLKNKLEKLKNIKVGAQIYKIIKLIYDLTKDPKKTLTKEFIESLEKEITDLINYYINDNLKSQKISKLILDKFIKNKIIKEKDLGKLTYGFTKLFVTEIKDNIINDKTYDFSKKMILFNDLADIFISIVPQTQLTATINVLNKSSKTFFECNNQIITNNFNVGKGTNFSKTANMYLGARNGYNYLEKNNSDKIIQHIKMCRQNAVGWASYDIYLKDKTLLKNMGDNISDNINSLFNKIGITKKSYEEQTNLNNKIVSYLNNNCYETAFKTIKNDKKSNEAIVKQYSDYTKLTNKEFERISKQYIITYMKKGLKLNLQNEKDKNYKYYYNSLAYIFSD